MVQLSYTGQQLDQAIKKVRADADIYTVLNGTKFGTGTAAYYSINVTATNIVADINNPVQIYEDSSVTLNFTADGITYKTPIISPVPVNAGCIYVRTSNTKCSVILSNPTGNVTLNISGLQMVTTSFSVQYSGGTDSLLCETGMTWSQFSTSQMAGSNNINIVGTDVFYKGEKLFTTNEYTTPITASSTIEAGTYYGVDTSLILTGTWLFAENIPSSEPSITQNVTFTSNNTVFTSMSVVESDLMSYGSTPVYAWTPYGQQQLLGWLDPAYRTVTFTGNTPVTATFKAFLIRNAIQLS